MYGMQDHLATPYGKVNHLCLLVGSVDKVTEQGQ